MVTAPLSTHSTAMSQPWFHRANFVKEKFVDTTLICGATACWEHCIFQGVKSMQSPSLVSRGRAQSELKSRDPIIGLFVMYLSYNPHDRSLKNTSHQDVVWRARVGYDWR